MYYKFVLYQCQSCVTILYIITVITEIKIIAILVNNAFKTVQQSVKDKEDICRRADARQRYLMQDFTLCWTGLRCIISEDCYRISNINYDNHSLINVYTGGIIMPNDFIVRPKCTDKKEDRSITMTIRLERELQEQYDDLSAKSGRSRNELMCMALRYALDNLKFIE